MISANSRYPGPLRRESNGTSPSSSMLPISLALLRRSNRAYTDLSNHDVTARSGRQ
jgi:hypothetical protein